MIRRHIRYREVLNQVFRKLTSTSTLPDEALINRKILKLEKKLEASRCGLNCEASFMGGILSELDECFDADTFKPTLRNIFRLIKASILDSMYMLMLNINPNASTIKSFILSKLNRNYGKYISNSERIKASPRCRDISWMMLDLKRALLYKRCIIRIAKRESLI